MVFDSSLQRPRSDLWYVLPVLSGILGGLISYFAIKYDDPKKARNCLFLGIILTVIPIVMMIIPFLFFSVIEFSTELKEPNNPPSSWKNLFLI